MPQVIRPIPAKQLDDALARAVAADPGLAAARATLLHPLRLLEALARDAGATLQDDGAAIERTRLLLSRAAISVRGLLAAVAGPKQARALLDYDAEDLGEPDEEDRCDEDDEDHDDHDDELHEGHEDLLDLDNLDDHDDDQPPSRYRLCQGGILELSGLVIAGLAAARVGRRVAKQNVAAGFVLTVEALAIAALPAESLAQGLDDGLDDDQLVALLSAVRGEHATELVALAPLFLDRVVQARFKAIRYLFRKLRDDAAAHWDSTSDEQIVAVERIFGTDDQPEKKDHLRVRLDAGDNEATNALLDRLVGEQATAKFVFLTDDGEVIEAAATSIRKANDFADVRKPKRALSGWIGIATDESKAAARSARKRIRRKWMKIDNRPPLRRHSVEVDLISVPEDDRALPPPRSPAACWGVEITAIDLRQVDGASLVEHVRTQVSVGLDRSVDRGRVEYEIGVSGPSFVEFSGDTASFELDPEWIVDDAELRVRLFVGDSEVPDDQRTATVEIPPVAEVRRVVLLSFTFVGERGVVQIGGERRLALERAAARADRRVEFVALPWIADGDLVSYGDPGDRSPAAGEALLGQLAALAGRTPGLEDAIVVALVPGDGKYAIWQPAEAAAAIACATPAALVDVLAAIEPAEGTPTRRTLRIIGELTAKRIRIDEPIRVDERGVGPGAPHASPYVAVLCDEHGVELSRTVITTHASSGFGGFVALLELPQAATRLELRAGDAQAKVSASASSIARLSSFGLNIGATLERPFLAAPTKLSVAPRLGVERPQGSPAIQLRKPTPAALEWRYQHTQGVPGEIEIEVGRAGLWSRVLRVSSKVDRVALDLDERPIGPAPTHLRVVASDGWNTVASDPVALPELGPGKALLIRSAGGERYYAEASERAEALRWGSADDDSFSQIIGLDGLLKLPPRVRADSLVVKPQLGD